MSLSKADKKRRELIKAKVKDQFGVDAPYPSTVVIDRWLRRQRSKGSRKVPEPYLSWDHISCFFDRKFSREEIEFISNPRL
jgi:hypothetical protein